MTLAGGTLDLEGASRLAGKLTWANGTLDLGGELAIDGGAEWATGTNPGVAPLGLRPSLLTLSPLGNRVIWSSDQPIQ